MLPLHRLVRPAVAMALSRQSGRTLLRQQVSTSPVSLDTFRVQDEDDFKSKVLQSDKPVIVDFTATWCGPCKMLGPRLDAAVAATGGDVNLALVDIDDLSDLALDHGVQAVPTVVAMRDGKEVGRFVGLLEEDKLDAFVQGAKKNP